MDQPSSPLSPKISDPITFEMEQPSDPIIFLMQSFTQIATGYITSYTPNMESSWVCSLNTIKNTPFEITLKSDSVNAFPRPYTMYTFC